jgi:hypothetical protein
MERRGEMRNKSGKLNGDNAGNHATYVDLNDEKVQGKILAYIRNGVPASDKKYGHHVRLQTKVIPIQADILESIREKAPAGYWKNQSELLRSVIAVGCYVTLRYLNHAEDIKPMAKDFQLLDIINMIAKQTREGELEIEARKAIFALNSNPVSTDQLIVKLQEALNSTR